MSLRGSCAALWPLVMGFRFGEGRMEKDAAGGPSLPSPDGLTNPGASRISPAAYLTLKGALRDVAS